VAVGADPSGEARGDRGSADSVIEVRFGLHLPQLGVLSDPLLLVDLAERAEVAEWDGFFVWDHLMHAGDLPACDPWVALGAVAGRTERLTLGPLVTPLPRRRPWKVAREAVTLDRLTQGHSVLGVGIGTDHYREFAAFDEAATNDRERAELLDEGLEVITSLWRGHRVNHTGAHFHVDDVLQIPEPIQAPRIPIWCAAIWPHSAPLRRAARWDGVVPMGRLTPSDVADLRTQVDRHRVGTAPFDVALATAAASGSPIAEYEVAGVTWWLVSIDPRATMSSLQALVDNGPPGR
jgi:alkanesulfonate monooxygenase SsuD/methylene tetrahydromethanopterin reductase-like flavin-dependent oxidoreductase (luciferase family)